MRSLTFTVFLVASLNLFSQSIETDSLRYGWGPGVVGECVDASDLQIRLRSWPYVVAGNSIYDTESESTCYVKVRDFNNSILGIDNHYSGDGDYLTLWTSDDEYRYYRETDLLERFTAYGLLSPFLVHPIKDISATTVSYSCITQTEEHVTHVATKVEDALPSLKYEHTPAEEELGQGYQINGIRTEELSRILRAVNLEPMVVPSLSECDIREEDVVAYIENVKEWSEFYSMREEWEKNDSLQKSIAEKRVFYLELLPRFDTVSSDVVRVAILVYREALMFSFGGSEQGVEIVNEANDTVRCRSSGGSISPYNMPWTISYNGVEFMTFNIELARILMKMLPNDGEERFIHPENQHNPALLRTVANYLFNEHQASQDVESPE